MQEKKIEEKKEKKVQLNQDTVIKIITGVIMAGIVLYLANNNSNIFGNFKKDVLGEDSVKVQNVVDVEKTTNNISEKQKAAEPVGKTVLGGTASEEGKEVFSHSLITPAEYKEKLKSGGYVHIDIRTPEEYNTEKISEGLNIDYYAPDFKGQLDKLDKSKKYIYHCRSGSRTANAVSIFRELGFGEVLELKGGMNNWKTKYSTI